MAKKTILNMADATWHDHDINFARRLHPAMWRVALESWQWIHQVAAPCNVIRGSGMTCHWICPNVRHIEILHMVSIFTISLQAVNMSFCTSLRNFIQIRPPSDEKMTSCRFSRWRISAIWDFRGSTRNTFPNHRRPVYQSLYCCIMVRWSAV